MKKNNDFYRVVNAVINTLNHGDSVAYVKNGVCGKFDASSDRIEVRRELMTYGYCEEIDEDELEAGFTADTNDFDFYELMKGAGEYKQTMQISINPDNYVTSSYKLRDMICQEQDLQAAEITEGMNGYPRGLRGAVLLSGCGRTAEQMKELADLYGVEMVSLHRRDGWQLWESQGWTWDLYDFADFMAERNDNLHRWDSYEEYAEELREYANDGDMDEDMKQEFLDAAEKVEGWTLGENEFLYCEQGYPYLTLDCVEKAQRMVDHFSYDTHQYALGLDCGVEE